MQNKNEKLILNIIRFSPAVLIILVTTFASFLLYNKHQKNILNEKRLIEEQYIEDSKTEIKTLIDTTHNLMNDIKNDTTHNLEFVLRNEVENAYTSAYSIFNKYKNIKSKEEITELIKSLLRSVRFNNGRGYLFIYEMDGKNILNSEFPHLEGKNLWNYKDSKGTLLLQEMNKILKTKSETFYEWYWQKPDYLKQEYRKVGFFKKFEPYDWFIGTGEYYEDFDNVLKQTILTYARKIRYKNSRYIFITNKNGEILVNKYYDLIGKNVKDLLTDSQKKKIENIDTLKDGLFLEYKLEENSINKESKRKISYVKLLNDWNWIIGTGFSLDEANESILKKQKILEEKYNEYLGNSIILSILLVLILLIISNFLSKYIEKIFYKYKLDLEKKHKILVKAQQTAHIGDWRLNIKTMEAYWSDEILSIFGIEKKPKVLGPAFLKGIMHEDDWNCFETSMTNSISNNKEHACTYRIIRPIDKRVVWIDCRGKKSDSGNHIYGTIQDITKRVELEKEKKYKESLLYQQSKMAAMGEMLGNIAHQWRQPLSIISSTATGAKVQNELGLLTLKNVNSYFDTINDTAQHLSQTIEDFRTFFNPKKNELKEFNLEDAIKKALNLVSSQFKTNNIEIIKNIEDIKILSLENELVQALVNILNNSRDALLENIEENQKRYIFISTKKNRNDITLEIYDNASGISKDIIDRVFEPYFTTKHQLHGTGIGLYMTNEIITKLLNGSIIVKNKKYKYSEKNYIGAYFIIQLPYFNDLGQ